LFANLKRRLVCWHLSVLEAQPRMKQRDIISLAVISVLVVISLIIVLPGTSARLKDIGIQRSMDFVLGLDLRGGVQALLEVPADYKQEVTLQQLEDAQRILENRTNALGVSENQFQVAGTNRIVAEFPGLTDPERVLSVIKETGQLEFVDLGDTRLSEGTKINTDLGGAVKSSVATATPGATPTTAAGQPTPTPAAAANPNDPSQKTWHTIMTGDHLKTVGVTTDQLGKYILSFELDTDGAKIFGDYTKANVGKILAIVLDKTIISAPSINSAITEGKGIIEGSFTNDTANALAIQMRYGALPIPFQVVESRVIGPTLGQDSLQKSLIAGIIGFSIVILFMGIYYRLPGFVAIISIAIYAVITLALFKLIPVTLTLPGIAGFLLSTGSALDANILIFERLKEELRSGRTFLQAVDLAWKRAWPSIRDSNIATLITCFILFIFGSSFGATIVKGFAVTLSLGVFVSLFCAIIVTRTLLNLVMAQINPEEKHLAWFGLYE
jgi:preprotein translocase subunit SecD